MKEKKLSEGEWKRLVNHFLSELAKSATRGRGGVQQAANTIGVSKQRISDMRSSEAIGDKISWTRMLLYKAGLGDADAKKILEHPNIVIKNIDSPSAVDEKTYWKNGGEGIDFLTRK